MLKRILSLLLLAVFTTETTPDALLHLLAHHEDTIDHSYAETVISNHHLHCDALQLSIPVFDKPEQAVTKALQLIFCSFSYYYNQSIFSKAKEVPSLRGPPAC